MGALFQVSVSWITLKTVGYRWMLIITAMPIFVLLGMFFCVPESIRYLLAKGRYDRANRLLRRMSKVNKMQLPPGNLKVLNHNTNEFAPMSSKVKAICNNSYRHDTIMLTIIWISNAAIYYGVVLLSTELIQLNDERAVTATSNSTTRRLLLQQHTAESADLQCSDLFTGQEFGELFLSAFSETPGMLLTFFLVDRIGRKKTQTLLFSIVTICFSALYFANGQGLTADTAVLAIVRACILGTFTVVYIYTPERYDTKIRSTAMGILVAGSRLGSMVSPFISVDLPEHGYPRTPFLIYGIMSIIALFASLCLKLETKGLSMDNIEDESRAVEMQSRVFKQGSSDSNGASVANIGLQFRPLKDDEVG